MMFFGRRNCKIIIALVTFYLMLEIFVHNRYTAVPRSVSGLEYSAAVMSERSAGPDIFRTKVGRKEELVNNLKLPTTLRQILSALTNNKLPMSPDPVEALSATLTDLKSVNRSKVIENPTFHTILTKERIISTAVEKTDNLEPTNQNTAAQEPTNQKKAAQAVKPAEGFHIIMFLSIFAGEVWPKYENFTAEQRKGRDQEVTDALQHNLNNPLVSKIHLLYFKDHEIQAIQNLKLQHEEKLVSVKLGRLIHMADFFRYPSTYLIDKPVIAMNSDIVIGDGFEKIDTIKMRDAKIIFSLSRYGDINGRCSLTTECQRYQGSHDTHIFRLSKPLDDRILSAKLDYPTNMWQAENGMIYVMQAIFRFKVRNPCHILKTNHEHCSKVHGSGSFRDYTIRDLSPYNITTDQIRKSGLGTVKPEKSLTYTNTLLKVTSG